MVTTMRNLKRSLVLFLAVAGATSGSVACAAVLIDDYSVPAVAAALSTGVGGGTPDRSDSLNPGVYAFPDRYAKVTANAGGLVTAGIGNGSLVNASSSTDGGNLSLDYSGALVNFYAGGGTALELDFFSIFPVVPGSMTVVATVNGVISSLPQVLATSAVPSTVSIPFASFSNPAALAAVTSLNLTFNFGSAGFFTLNSVNLNGEPPIGAVPEPGAVLVWALLGICAAGMVKVTGARLGSGC